MPAQLPRPVQDLIDMLTRLPGVGPKMAARLTFHLIQKSSYEIGQYMDALDGIRSGLQNCSQCGYISVNDLCDICKEDARNIDQICVVEGSLDVIALEKTGIYHGLYHVLGGALSPIDGIGPDQLRLQLLKSRVEEKLGKDEKVELILATNPSLEGEATAQYIVQMFAEHIAKGLKITRIARGLPMGSDLEYADPTTLARALEGRK